MGNIIGLYDQQPIYIAVSGDLGERNTYSVKRASFVPTLF
jgi:hypothetical protein